MEKVHGIVIRKSPRNPEVALSLSLLFSLQEPHRRSQLWRMTSGGLLSHEGSSPPSVKPGPANAGLVLDIDSLAPPTCGKYVRLVLSKPNPRRLHSQTWSFTEVILFFIAVSMYCTTFN